MDVRSLGAELHPPSRHGGKWGQPIHFWYILGTLEAEIDLFVLLILLLVAKSGLEEKTDDENNYMVLYTLAVLPFISICDVDLFNDLFTDLVTDVDWILPSNLALN